MLSYGHGNILGRDSHCNDNSGYPRYRAETPSLPVPAGKGDQARLVTLRNVSFSPPHKSPVSSRALVPFNDNGPCGF